MKTTKTLWERSVLWSLWAAPVVALLLCGSYVLQEDPIVRVHDITAWMTLAYLAASMILGVERMWRAKSPTNTPKKWVVWIEELYPLLLLLLIWRSAGAEMFRIPSGSMKPTLLEGDFVWVNKHAYGVRLPITLFPLVQGAAPQRGDVVVFHHPDEPKKQFVKRVIGLPGDTIRYAEKTFYINGTAQEIRLLGKDQDHLSATQTITTQRGIEELEHTAHELFLYPQRTDRTDQTWTVGEGEYFVSGDNRDNSKDSRMYGPLSGRYIVGRVDLVFLSWDAIHRDMRWSRSFNTL